MILAKIKYGFTLGEMVDKLPYESTINLSTLLTSLNITYTIAEVSLIEVLFNKLVNKYNDKIVFMLDKQDAELEGATTSAFRKWMSKFITLYEESKDYYETTIGLYTNNKNKLMDIVESSSINEVFFNDTPQNEGGVFDDTSYTTNYTKTKTTNKSQMNTPMARLKEITDNLEMLWRDWLVEMEKLFIENIGGEY